MTRTTLAVNESAATPSCDASRTFVIGARGGRLPTPAAIVERGATPRRRVVRGSLNEIAGLAREAGIESPATVVLGHVVTPSDELSWFGETCAAHSASHAR